MEFEVKLVGGIENCYVSLPLLLIQTLQSTRSGLLPQVLALELRSSNGDLWVIAWSGSASTSSSIEVAQQFADCINLPDHTTVQVRAVANLPKATLVTIEPHSEDDWEVLELNSEHAEAAILKQVRIVHEAMRFPLWLHGQTIVTFLVVSTFPKKAVVQLVPGTEVAVAPKRRKKNMESHEDSYIQSPDKEHLFQKALLRVQDQDKLMIHKSEVKGVELGIILTSVVFIHPETAKNYALEPLQLVSIVPRSSPKEGIHENDTLRNNTNSTPKEMNSGKLTDKQESRQAIVRLLFSELVVKGHVMIARSLRLYLRAGLHSWIYMKRCNVNLKKDIYSLSISPCQFTIPGKNKALMNNSLEAPDSRRSRMAKNMLLWTNSDTYMDMVDWSIHEEVVNVLSNEFSRNEDEEAVINPDRKRGLQSLLQTWFFAQLDAITSNAGVEVNSLVLGSETLLHFELTIAKTKALPNGSLDKSKMTGYRSVEFFYVLACSEESLHGGKVNAYEVAFDGVNKRYNNDLGDLEMLFGKLKFGDPVSFYSVKERTSKSSFGSTISSLSWMGTAAADVINRFSVLLSPTSGMWLSTNDIPLPGHVLIYGPPGSGKTLLARTVAKSLEERGDLLAHVIFVCCSGLALEKAPIIRQLLSDYISEALDHAPSVIIFDDLDSIISSPSDSEGSRPSVSVVALTEVLTDVMDEYEEKRKSSCGIGPIAFLASVRSLENIPQSLSSSGRFDFHIQLPAPAALERGAILKHEIQKRLLQCPEDVLLDVASKCEGYDAHDLEILVDRTVHAAIGRFLPSHSAFDTHEKPTLVRDDFSNAMHEFLPVAMRDVSQSASEGGRSGWDDVGGLTDIRVAINEMIELPSKFPNIFAQAPLRLRSNVLLYGPPGCGKTHIVGAAAAACSLRFISVKGPELLNKYIGASEQAVRDIFSKAAAAAPCLLFFDEFDSIAPKRGHDNTGVTDRVVNQFLTELDGVEVLTGVFVFAATSRPDLLDAALLRPGRLDRLLFCDFPSRRERLDILKVLSKKLTLGSDVDLEGIAYMTEGFSGADLQALFSDAQLAAVHKVLEDSSSSSHLAGKMKMPVITNAVLKSIASQARPSVSDVEKQRLYQIYSQFLDSKRSVADQSRDSKGKRATLA